MMEKMMVTEAEARSLWEEIKVKTKQLRGYL